VKQVVFVDDEADIVELYEELFAGDTIAVTVFTQPTAAIEHFAQHAVDVCFIDFRMPVMNGIELRSHLPDGPRYYLITGELDMDCPEGFTDKFSKPLDFEDVENMLASL
jgi:CheY-like chemotaxis protein